MEIEECDNLMLRILGAIEPLNKNNDIEIIVGTESNNQKDPRIVFDRIEIRSCSTIIYEVYFYAKSSEEMTHILNQFVKIRDSSIPGYDELKKLGSGTYTSVVNWLVENLEKKKDHWFSKVKLSNLDFTGYRAELLKQRQSIK